MTIDVRNEDGVQIWTWSSPDRSTNVVDAEALTALGRALEGLRSDGAARGAILTSGKDTFAVGGDLRRIEAMARGEIDVVGLSAGITDVLALLRAIETCGKPVVAAMNGSAVGGGYEIALACHRRIAADDPRLQIGLPETQWGLLPGAGGTQRLPRLIGILRAAPILLEGKNLRPEEALAQGLIDEVVPRAELLAAAKRWILGGGKAVQPWDQKGYEIPGGGPEGKAGRMFFTGANAMLRARSAALYPAGRAMLSAMYEGLQLPLERATRVETRLFVELLRGPVARRMLRTLFLGVQSAQKGARRPKDVPAFEPGRVGVLGAGLMGSGIAAACAQAGLEVVLLDRDLAAAERGKAGLARQLDRLVEKGRMDAAKRDRVLARITPTADFAALAGAGMVVEAVFEDRAVKADVTRRAEAVVGPAAIFGTNTSTLPITGLAEASVRPESFIGVHFFSPVERMQLVEVIRGRQTSDRALAGTLDFIRRIGKTPIVVNDSRGFYTSRVFGTYLTEGSAMLLEGVRPALIENAGRMAGMPMPPLQLADEVGLALMHQVREQTRKDLGGALPENPTARVLEIVVGQLGRTGKRDGKGFYDYVDGQKALFPGLAEHFPPAAEQPAVGALIERFLYVQALEAARCMEEGVLLAAEDADVGAVLGWGFAPYTGGPLSLIDTVGAARFVERCSALAGQHGQRFSPPQLLAEMAAGGRSFY